MQILMKRSCFVKTLLNTALGALSVLSPGWVYSGNKTDVIHLKNGDKLTGEIRLVEHGILQFDCDYGSGRFNIYWDQIERIETDKVISAELSSGQRIRGPAETKPSGDMTISDPKGKSVDFSLPEVAWMQEGTKGFWGHFDSSVDVGYSLTQSNNTQQVTANGNLIYNADKYNAKVTVGTLFNTQTGAESTQRTQGDLFFRRMLGQKWFGFGGFGALHSDELELSIRSTLGGGAGRYLHRDFQHSFALAGGAVWNREVYFDPGIANQNSPEAVVLFQYDFFNLFGHNVNLINEIRGYKSLSRGSRTRVDLHHEVRWSLPRSFYINLGISDNFDSSPIRNTPRNDFVLTTGFGWSP